MQLNEAMDIGSRLAEGKWNEWVSDIKNPYNRVQTALLLENQDKYNRAFVMEAVGKSQRIDEATLSNHPGLATLEMQSFPLVRGMLPNLISSEIVNVQTMLSTYAPIHFMTAKFGTTKGSVNKGDNLFETFGKDYTGESIDSETVGTGDGDTSVALTSLTYTPVRPGSVLLTNGTYELRDNGRGGFIRTDTGAAAAGGAINYTTGAFSTAPVWPASFSTDVVATYEFNSEGGDFTPQIDLSIVSTPVVARSRQVRFRYSKIAQLNLGQQWSIDPDAELTQQGTQLLRWEMDREVISDLRKVAAAGTVEFKTNPQAGVSLAEHNAGFVNTLTTAKNLIFSATQYGTANWVIMSPEVANIVESLPGFVPSGLIGGRGPIKAGVLNGQWVCYKDPDPSFANQFLVGFKGENWLDTGYVLAPYIAYYATDSVTLDDFLTRKGLGTMYGKRVIQPKFYCKGLLKND